MCEFNLVPLGSIYYAGFNTNWPVVIQVSQLVCQALKVVWCQPGAVLNHVVMGWRHCSLTNWLADKKEVIPGKNKTIMSWCVQSSWFRGNTKAKQCQNLFLQAVDQFSLVRNNTLTHYIIKQFSYHSLRVISVSTTVPGGGFVRFTASPDLWKILALILFLTMTTENLGLKIKKRDPYNNIGKL